MCMLGGGDAHPCLTDCEAAPSFTNETGVALALFIFITPIECFLLNCSVEDSIVFV